MYKPQYPGLYYFDTFTFTTLGTSGSSGPDVTKGYANAPWREGDFSIQDGQQHWTVPANGTYQITAAGAYGATPGRVVTGQVKLNEGQTLTMLVGQCPSQLTVNVQDNVTIGGGGGTFVVSDKPLIIASGGDGSAYSTDPWSQPVLVDGNIPSFLSDTFLSIINLGISFNFNGSSVYEYIDNNWIFKYGFDYDFVHYVDKDIVYSSNIINSTTLRINEYIPGNSSVQKYTDLTTIATPSYFNVTVSQNGMSLILYDSGHYNLYRRIGNNWTFMNQIDDFNHYGGSLRISSDGNRFICRPESFSGGPVYVYDYPWQTETTKVTLSEGGYISIFCISPDGTLIVGRDNIYSIETGQIVSVLPGYGFLNGQYVSISGDNTTVLKGAYGYDLQIITQGVINTLLSTSFLSFVLRPLINDSGTIIASCDSPKMHLYYKNAKPQSGNFLPSGDGLGGSGAGYLGDGTQADPYFGFLTPKAYTNGGFGNAYEYGVVTEQGGFGGGQCPISNLNQITSFTCSAPTNFYIDGTDPLKLAFNDDTTILYADGVRYIYSGGSWNTDYSGGQDGNPGFCSMSDDGNVYIDSPLWQYLSPGSPQSRTVKLVNGSQTISLDDVLVARVSKNGSRVVYANSTNTVFFRDAPFNVENQLVSLSQTIYSIDVSSDGSVIAIGTKEGVCFIVRSEITETISSAGSIVGLSPDGNTLFSLDLFNSVVRAYEYLNNAWKLVTSSISTYKNILFLTTTYNGFVCGNPLAIQDQNSFVLKYTNKHLASTGQFPYPFITSICSGGSNVLTYASYNYYIYPKQSITTSTIVNHAFPHQYQVQFEQTSNYNGTHDITVVSSNTFTFEGFSGINESGTLGVVYGGLEKGVSGGGGYTGSPGDGVSGATCYADESVSNFTDLGASSNSAGYVTVSLVDPKPLGQTWSWSPNAVDTSSRNPILAVSWFEDTFLCSTGVSSDGINWNCISLVEALAQGKQPINPIVYMAYSPTLKIYVGTNNTSTLNVKYSQDRITWTTTYTEISTGGKIIWVDEFQKFYIRTTSNILSSTNGINWSVTSQASPSYTANPIVYAPGVIVSDSVYSTDGSTWYSNSTEFYAIAYSIQLGLFVASSSDPFSTHPIQYSYNGQTWLTNGVNLPLSGPRNWTSIVWSDKHQLFSMFSDGSTKYSAYSSDGLNWSVLPLPSLEGPRIYDIAYSPQLDFYVATSFPDYFISIEGKYWAKRGSGLTIIGQCAWSPQLDILVGSSATTHALSNSRDGITWNLITNKQFYTIEYSRDLNIFVALEYFSGNVWYSYDGTNFTDTVFEKPGNPQALIWSKELGLFCSGFGYSRDGIYWTSSFIEPFNTSSSVSIGWSSDLQILTAITQYSNVYYSSDGKNWTLSETVPDTFFPQNIVWASSLGKFFAITQNTHEVYYSINGKNWTYSSTLVTDSLFIVWIPEINMLAVNQNYSYDGTNWTLFSNYSFTPVTWIPEKQKLLCQLGYSVVQKAF